MGQSTDAYLYYGIQLEEGYELPWQKEIDEELYWEDFYANEMGVFHPIEEYDENTKSIYKEYWDKKRVLIKECKCEVDSHCSCDYPIYYVCIKESVKHASRGCPTIVESLDVGENWNSLLEDFCKIMELPYEEPKWWLSSMWC
ncbi:MAG: hypothetical protein WC503_01040 [Candidatus Shapirobacteria bacterium]